MLRRKHFDTETAQAWFLETKPELPSLPQASTDNFKMCDAPA